jgi:hypothetical protein
MFQISFWQNTDLMFGSNTVKKSAQLLLVYLPCSYLLEALLCMSISTNPGEFSQLFLANLRHPAFSARFFIDPNEKSIKVRNEATQQPKKIQPEINI